MCDKCKVGEICVDGLLDGSVGLVDGAPSKGFTITRIEGAPDWMVGHLDRGMGVDVASGKDETRMWGIDKNGVQFEVFEIGDAARVFLETCGGMDSSDRSWGMYHKLVVNELAVIWAKHCENGCGCIFMAVKASVVDGKEYCTIKCFACDEVLRLVEIG